MAAIYAWDDDEVWKRRPARRPASSPTPRTRSTTAAASWASRRGSRALELSWHGRGENVLAYRRVELRRVAEAKIDAMKKAADGTILSNHVERSRYIGFTARFRTYDRNGENRRFECQSETSVVPARRPDLRSAYRLRHSVKNDDALAAATR
jgi:hypothetical protein